jgi:hypothetical protein
MCYTLLICFERLIICQWETQGLESQATHHHGDVFDFPPDDLLKTLIDRYFAEFNDVLNLLYRPAFERSVEAGLHLRNERFASVVLLVCAVGSGYVDDSRVLIDGAMSSSGWRFFNQVQIVRKSLLAPPALYDLQIICVSQFFVFVWTRLSKCFQQLAVMFLKPWSVPQAYWSLLGMGLRMAQDIGIHRKRTFSKNPNVQEEQWKRAFWCVLSPFFHLIGCH